MTKSKASKRCLFKRSFIHTMTPLFAAMMLAGCSDSSDDKSPVDSKCSTNADCASNMDGKTECKDGACVAPASTGCKTNVDCANNKDGKTECQNSVCVAPAPTGCTSNTDCANNKDGKTECQNSVCVTPGTNPPTNNCGNGIIDDGEACDGTQLGDKTCTSFPEYVGGTLTCNASCQLNKSDCAECTDNDKSKCQSGYKCSYGHCVPQNHEITCGDNIAEGNEACDGTDLKGKTCADMGNYNGGTLKCSACAILDASGCTNSTTPPTPSRANVVISQIYPGGGNKNAIYKTKYIVLLNAGDNEADISNWSIQYAAKDSTDNITSVCNLPENTKLPKGGYYLVELKSGDNGADLPIAADHSCKSVAPSASDGKLFLVNSTTKLSTATPDIGYVDAVGYGKANWGEGNAPMEALTSTTAGIRRKGGCFDTNNNAADFNVAAPNPHNSQSPASTCQDGGDITETCNGILDPGEDCDGTAFKEDKTTCNQWNPQYKAGKVTCNACQIDYGACLKECATGQEWSDQLGTCAYTIANADDLFALANNWNQKGEEAYPAGSAFIITSDFTIDKPWLKAIGSESKPFTGTFYGNDKTITITPKSMGNSENDHEASLFGDTQNASVGNLNITCNNPDRDGWCETKAQHFHNLLAHHVKGGSFQNIKLSFRDLYWKAWSNMNEHGLIFEDVQDATLENITYDFSTDDTNLDMDFSMFAVSLKNTRVSNLITTNHCADGIIKGINIASFAFTVEGCTLSNINILGIIMQDEDESVYNLYWIKDLKGNNRIDLCQVYNSSDGPEEVKQSTFDVIKGSALITNFIDTSYTYQNHSFARSMEGATFINVNLRGNYNSALETSKNSSLINALFKSKATAALIQPKFNTTKYVYNDEETSAKNPIHVLLNGHLMNKDEGIVSGKYLPWEGTHFIGGEGKEDSYSVSLKFDVTEAQLFVVE